MGLLCKIFGHRAVEGISRRKETADSPSRSEALFSAQKRRRYVCWDENSRLRRWMVLQGPTFEIFHMGSGNAETAHLLFACAQRKFELAVLDHYE